MKAQSLALIPFGCTPHGFAGSAPGSRIGVGDLDRAEKLGNSDQDWIFPRGTAMHSSGRMCRDVYSIRGVPATTA